MQYPSTEFTDAAFALEPSFSPPDAPSPEVFDQEFAELDLGLPYAEQSDGFFTSTTFRDFRPVISPVSGPLTYSTTCVYGETSSHYSSDLTRSGHLTSDVQVEALEGYSSNNGLPGTHDIHSAVFSNGPPFVPPLHGAEDEFAFGTSFFSPNFAGITSEDSSTAVQLPFTPPHSVHQMTPDSEAQEQMAPTPDRDRPFKCPQSPHSAKRKHNLKTHLRPYNKSKPSKCSTCGRRFSLKNDLHRQQKLNHTSKADDIV